ncbi:uncharacterized protein LY89DRAFT_685201 [Mollisia scopiformis]|uniref:Uncharacterized protein n=1 Tax=Mollisia scopiformis TaxID=149040 RepID=A0A194X8Q0_MOLSC|nr:uncharacterized protein LY89DRAFT_685201 [Mollisia scopiformis]KUJ16162.1 hypothetical protein LY89DRAFT_685201 [Mollisia scopiformis]
MKTGTFRSFRFESRLRESIARYFWICVMPGQQIYLVFSADFTSYPEKRTFYL